MYPPVTVYTSNHPGDIDSLSLKAQIGIYKCLETTRILPDVQSADGIEYRSYEVETVRVSEPGSLDADDFLSKLKYESYEAERNRLIRNNLDSSCKITVNFWYNTHDGKTSSADFCIKIQHSDSRGNEVEITYSYNSTLWKISDSFVTEIVSSFDHLPDNIDQLQTLLKESENALEERVIKHHKGAETVSKQSKLIDRIVAPAIVIIIVLLIGFGAWYIFFNPGSGSSSQSREEEIAEDMEFLDNISTPGTSEYDWYHDEYLPDNGYPDD